MFSYTSHCYVIQFELVLVVACDALLLDWTRLCVLIKYTVSPHLNYILLCKLFNSDETCL